MENRQAFTLLGVFRLELSVEIPDEPRADGIAPQMIE
jgi:hypothetical protein